jgi:hypothetical protein
MNPELCRHTASGASSAPVKSRCRRQASTAGLLALGLLAAAVSGAVHAQGPAPALQPGMPPDMAAQAPANKQDYSPAERLLFMGKQMTGLKPPTSLRYNFRKSGALEEGFEDKVNLDFKRAANGRCCTVTGDFLSGARRLQLPDVENAEANPVLLYFLERDIREMQRLTKGSPSYYRKRIRMAAYEATTVSTVTLVYKGKTISGQQVDLLPYRDDPARSRFEKFARKSYRFLLSNEVPGGVFGMRTVMSSDAADAPPMIVEELFLEGARVPQANQPS